MNIKEEFEDIFNEWDPFNPNKTYDRIIHWILKYKEKIKSQESIYSIFHRICNPNENIQDIIYDFMQGSIYEDIRSEFY